MLQNFKYSTDEIKEMTKSMIVLVDTREKRNKHITDYFDKNNVSYRRCKLDYGDYSFLLPAAVTGGSDIYFHRDCVIERKGSLEELSGNLTQSRERFEREMLRARNDGCKICLMTEDSRGYNAIFTHEYKTEMSPKSYMASLLAWQSRFDLGIQFVDKAYSGYFIVTAFQYFAREVLR